MKIWKISQISVSIPFSAFQDVGVGQPHPSPTLLLKTMLRVRIYLSP